MTDECHLSCLTINNRRVVLAVYLSFLFTSYRYELVYAYSQANSIYEDENIKLEIYNQEHWALNKTQKTIFIDLLQCSVDKKFQLIYILRIA